MVVDGFAASYRALGKCLSRKLEYSAGRMERVAEALELSEGSDDSVVLYPANT